MQNGGKFGQEKDRSSEVFSEDESETSTQALQETEGESDFEPTDAAVEAVEPTVQSSRDRRPSALHRLWLFIVCPALLQISDLLEKSRVSAISAKHRVVKFISSLSRNVAAGIANGSRQAARICRSGANQCHAWLMSTWDATKWMYCSILGFLQKALMSGWSFLKRMYSHTASLCQMSITSVWTFSKRVFCSTGICFRCCWLGSQDFLKRAGGVVSNKVCAWSGAAYSHSARMYEDASCFTREKVMPSARSTAAAMYRTATVSPLTCTIAAALLATACLTEGPASQLIAGLSEAALMGACKHIPYMSHTAPCRTYSSMNAPDFTQVPLLVADLAEGWVEQVTGHNSLPTAQALLSSQLSLEDAAVKVRATNFHISNELLNCAKTSEATSQDVVELVALSSNLLTRAGVYVRDFNHLLDTYHTLSEKSLAGTYSAYVEGVAEEVDSILRVVMRTEQNLAELKEQLGSAGMMQTRDVAQRAREQALLSFWDGKAKRYDVRAGLNVLNFVGGEIGSVSKQVMEIRLFMWDFKVRLHELRKYVLGKQYNLPVSARKELLEAASARTQASQDAIRKHTKGLRDARHR